MLLDPPVPSWYSSSTGPESLLTRPTFSQPNNFESSGADKVLEDESNQAAGAFSHLLLQPPLIGWPRPWVTLLNLNTALDAGVSPETLRKIESGRVATPAFATIAAIADVLGLCLDAVWAEINRPGGGVEPASSDRNAGERLVS